MRTPTSRPLLLIFGLSITLASPRALPAQGLDFNQYIGGGLRLGYVFGEGPSYGAEVTFGVLVFPIITSIALGIQSIPTAPRQLSYVSLSGSIFGMLGIAAGKTFYSVDGVKYGGTRSIIWGAMAVPLQNPYFGRYTILGSLVSLESYRFPNLDTQKWMIGLWGRFAFPRFKIIYT
ncbi:MAG: hypothetical protein IIA59_02090 [Candidatus Marinimicrobia bacterium]|nr:hypothetical protein [Candidatus Neomarinimicrobiota bacterium]